MFVERTSEKQRLAALIMRPDTGVKSLRSGQITKTETPSGFTRVDEPSRHQSEFLSTKTQQLGRQCFGVYLSVRRVGRLAILSALSPAPGRNRSGRQQSDFLVFLAERRFWHAAYLQHLYQAAPEDQGGQGQFPLGLPVLLTVCRDSCNLRRLWAVPDCSYSNQRLAVIPLPSSSVRS